MTGLPGDARERLAAVLEADHAPAELPCPDCRRDVDKLLPVVAELADLRAAEELRAAADKASYTPLSQREVGVVNDFTQGWHAAAEYLHRRAAALTPTAEGDRP